MQCLRSEKIFDQKKKTYYQIMKDPVTREPSQSLKLGRRTHLKFKSGTPGHKIL